MTSAVRSSAPARSRRAAMAVGLPLAVLSLALSACAQGGPAAEPTEQETAVQSSTPDPSSAPPPTAGSSPTASDPSAASATNAALTITIKQDAAAEPVQYVLECVDGAPGPASTLPGAEAACTAVAKLGAGFFTARPDKDIICTQQYGGPQTASISGEIDGTTVLAAFALTDGCEISRWDRVRDILGAPGGQ
ncbi:serine protease inhibitor [Arthrobacter sp. NPDC092385]|uniref:serine protease inhibitor n=1 Tax=Arthrobacter sp. NPDC092385 TaxID=3363943 RepID=UPI003802B056